MKRALIISYYWPPSGGSGVQRWVKFAKYLPSQGWQPVIYTPENPEAPSLDSSLAADVPPEAEVIRRPITEIYGIWRKLSGEKAAKEVNPINRQKKSLGQRLMMSLRGNLFIPDPRISWKRPSVRFLLQYLKEHPVDVIVSTGPPHSMHLIAKDVSRKSGTPWIADFRDPWTKMFYFKHLQLCGWARRRHESLEKAVLDACDRVVAVSPLVQEEFMSMTSTPVELITNGFDPDDFADGAKTVAEESGDRPFCITHTGLFASDGIPDALWTVLSEKCREDAEFDEKLRIRLIGKTDMAVLDSLDAAGLREKTEDLGYKDHSFAVKEQQTSAMLILPLRKEPEYKATLPGKLFEYLAACRPVLGIGQSDGAMARILSETGAGIVCEWEDKAAMRSFIDKCWGIHLSGESWNNTKNIGQYSRPAVTAKMAALMDSLTK